MEKNAKTQFRAYYYTFLGTGCVPIDSILAHIANAGGAYHDTSQWDDDEPSYIDLIQKAANEAADEHDALVARVEKLKAVCKSIKGIIESEQTQFVGEVAHSTAMAGLALINEALQGE